MHVRKRDGSLEPLDLDRIHKVVEWAAEGLSNVSVAEIDFLTLLFHHLEDESQYAAWCASLSNRKLQSQYSPEAKAGKFIDEAVTVVFLLIKTLGLRKSLARDFIRLPKKGKASRAPPGYNDNDNDNDRPCNFLPIVISTVRVIFYSRTEIKNHQVLERPTRTKASGRHRSFKIRLS